MSEKKEVWGEPPLKALDDIRALSEMCKKQEEAIKSNPPWFTLKSKTHRWWHWIIRPIKTYRLMKWLKHVTKEVEKNLDKEKIEKILVDQALYGYSEIYVGEDDD